jgi:hypothetical protein
VSAFSPPHVATTNRYQTFISLPIVGHENAQFRFYCLGCVGLRGLTPSFVVSIPGLTQLADATARERLRLLSAFGRQGAN